MVSKKERNEIIFMVCSVLFVGFLGFWLSSLAPTGTSTNTAGLAVSLDSNTPTYSGMLYLLQESCEIVNADGVSSCDELCATSGAVCIPLEETCSEISEYSCTCCTDISN